jgi:hypothetical protein
MNSPLTLGLLRLVSCDGANDGVLLSCNAVGGTLYISLGLSGFVLRLPGGVFLLSRLLPGSGTGDVADTLDDVAFGRVELTRGLAAGRKLFQYKSIMMECHDLLGFAGSGVAS